MKTKMIDHLKESEAKTKILTENKDIKWELAIYSMQEEWQRKRMMSNHKKNNLGNNKKMR